MNLLKEIKLHSSENMFCENETFIINSGFFEGVNLKYS